MGANVYFYKQTKITLDKNFIVESIEDYLSNSSFIVSSITGYTYQYVKHGKELFLKFNMDQSKLDMTNTNDIEYVGILNKNDARTYYYFVVNKTWKSENTIEMHLVMDTLNTFQWNTDYIVNKKTLVQREHKDRIIDNEVDDDVYQRNIDLRSEGINAPLYKNKEMKILQGDRSISWLLYYRNVNSYDPADPNAFTLDNPVACFIAPTYPIKARYGSGNSTINATSFVNNGYYYLTKTYQLEIGGNVFAPYGGGWEIHKKSNGKLDISRLSITEKYEPIDNFTYVYVKEVIAQDLDNFDIVEPTDSTINFRYFASAKTEPVGTTGTSVDIIITPTTIDFYLDPDNIDRTDSRNIKIIELPYAPTNITYDSVNDLYLFDDSWEYDGTQKLFKLKSFDLKFKSIFRSLYSTFWDNLLVDGINNASSNDLRNDKFESKIFHSDYYRPKFVYDSFGITFEYEKIDFDEWLEVCTDLGTTRLVIDFTASRNVISKFLFMFPQYITKYGQMDYDNIVAVSRNNEHVIYNSQYLNYIRNGYNYDLKSKQRSEEAQAFGLGASGITTLLGIIGSIATGNYGTAVLSGVAGGLSIANQAVNYAKNVAQSEQNIQQKLQEARMQAVSVQNADDIDILKEYSDNKAKMCWYEVSPTMKKALYDMFYYCGYATFEQKVPSINTRYWFNAVQCELVIDETSNIPDVLIEDIKDKFKQGATFFHEHNGKWDINQEKENYESWIIS